MLGNFCEIIGGYVKYVNGIRKQIEKEYDFKFDDYRKSNLKEKIYFILEKLSNLPMHKTIK